MGLAKIREKNKNKKSFVNSEIDYSSLSAKDIEDIKNKVFKGFIEPLNEDTLKESMKV